MSVYLFTTKASTLSALIRPAHFQYFFHFLSSDNYIFACLFIAQSKNFNPAQLLGKFKPACLLIYVKSTTMPVYWALPVY